MNVGPTEPYTAAFGAIPRQEEPARWPDPPPPPSVPWPPPMASATVVNNIKFGGYGRVPCCNHLLHGTLTVVTCGLWAPVWLGAWHASKRG